MSARAGPSTSLSAVEVLDLGTKAGGSVQKSIAELDDILDVLIVDIRHCELKQPVLRAIAVSLLQCCVKHFHGLYRELLKLGLVAILKPRQHERLELESVRRGGVQNAAEARALKR